MKCLCLFLLLVSVPAYADQSSGTASKFGIGPNRYCLVAATYDLIFVELRSFSEDRLLHDVVLLSRYMEPEYDIRDVVLDEYEEVVVRTRGGGTGIKETHLKVFGFASDRIVLFGDFIIERELTGPAYQEMRLGTVSFPEKNRLFYKYADSIVRDGKSVTKEVIEVFTFDPKSMSYRMLKEPEQLRVPGQ